MKKLLIALTLAVSCLGINKVSADVNELNLTDKTYEYFSQYKQSIGNENFNTIINDVLDEYKNKYMSSYPYFYISVDFNNNYGFETDGYFLVHLFYFKEVPSGRVSYVLYNGLAGVYHSLPFGYKDIDGDGYDDYTDYLSRKYPIYSDSNLIFDVNNYSFSGFEYHYITTMTESNGFYNPYLYYLSNFDLYFESIKSGLNRYGISSGFIFDYKNILIPKLGDDNISRVISLTQEDVFFEPYYLYDIDVDVSVPNIEEINLNDYAYVALALKNYRQDPFETTVQVKGQYCITPVYGMGLESFEDINGVKVQNVCTPYYDNYTPVKTYITKDNISNYSIYYVKAYDTSRDNYIKVDTSIFDISYITEENKNNPYVLIQGKTYPTIPYDDLPSSATQNTEEGYIPGESEKFSFSDIFTAPLEFLQEIWGTIATFFDLITKFILLLPPVLQGFLYSSFALAIVLGLIKILL